MRKFRKTRIIAACTLAATLSISAILPTIANAAEETIVIPKGFTSTAVDIKGANEALLGWQYYFYNDKDADGNERGWSYESEHLRVLATTEGRTGNAMHIQRDSADGQIVLYSYAFDVKADQNYVIGAFIKSICAQTANNKVYFMIKEQNANGTAVGDEYTILSSVDGRRDDWTETTFSYKTSTSAKTLVLKIGVEGVGDFYVDDITVKTSDVGVNSDTFKMIGIGNDGSSENPETMPVLTGANIAADSSDGDGKSLKLSDHDVYKTVFGILPHGGTYTLSFKYKNTSGGSADRLSIRLDNVTMDGTRAWYANGVSSTSGTADTDWQTYTYQFTAVAGQTDINWMGITSYGGYLIDELSITGTDTDGSTMQYVVNGSFSGAYLDGYTYGGNYNVAKQTDGTYVFASSAYTQDASSKERGYLKPDVSKLVVGTEYTLSFDYRSGGSGAGNVYYGAGWGSEDTNLKDICTLTQATTNSWTHKEVTFTAQTGAWFEIYGDTGIGWPTYFRNFSIKDAAGNEFITNKTLVAPEAILGENEFPYGTFTGNVNYVAEDWTFEGDGNIYGLVFDTRWEAGAQPDWKICLYGTEEKPAIAVSKEIAVSELTLALGYKKYTGNVKVSAIVGETEIKTDENGFIELPKGTTSVKLKFTATEYVALKKLFLGSHTHATPAEGDTTTEEPTCTKIGGTYYYCADCEKNVYLEKIAKLPHDLEHVHEDATCRDGIDKDVCKVCNQEFNVTVLPATGEHVYKKEVLKEATCTTNGTEQDVCEICGSKGNISVIVKKAHNYQNGKCTVCGAVDPDYTADDPGKEEKKSGCKSSVSGGMILLGSCVAAAFVIGKRKRI